MESNHPLHELGSQAQLAWGDPRDRRQSQEAPLTPTYFWPAHSHQALLCSVGLIMTAGRGPASSLSRRPRGYRADQKAALSPGPDAVMKKSPAPCDGLLQGVCREPASQARAGSLSLRTQEPPSSPVHAPFSLKIPVNSHFLLLTFS